MFLFSSPYFDVIIYDITTFNVPFLPYRIEVPQENIKCARSCGGLQFYSTIEEYSGFSKKLSLIYIICGVMLINTKTSLKINK